MQSVKSPLLSQYSNLLHAFSTKANGFSLKPFSSNNLAYHVNDNKQTVHKNHLQHAQYMNYDLNKLVHMNQVHGDNIKIIDKNTDLSIIPTCDALITNEPSIPLMVMVADCIPILLYDPIKHVIAVVHAGRAGVFNRIIIKTIEQMQEKFYTQTKDLLVVIGPSIHKCCYQVGYEIYEETLALGYHYAIKDLDNNYYLDLASIVKEQLKEVAVLQKNTEISQYCTSCNKNIFFSYRAEANNTGRFSGVLMLK